MGYSIANSPPSTMEASEEVPLFYQKMSSPLGEIWLVSTETHLVAVLWGAEDRIRAQVRGEMLEQSRPVLQAAAQQLVEYFNGSRISFDLPILLQGTEFQKKVWAILLEIPFGQTKSYGFMARQLGSIKTSRAVGAANGRNPIAIIVPCHRVIGANGDLTGFAGGMAAKEWLLRHEGVLKEDRQGVLF